MVELVRAHLEDDPSCRDLLVQHVQEATSGVRALQETYRDDVTVCASLERVFDKMAVLGSASSIKVDASQET
jgi:ADP-dependent phosphofructokinase/glucokinase